MEPEGLQASKPGLTGVVPCQADPYTVALMGSGSGCRPFGPDSGPTVHPSHRPSHRPYHRPYHRPSALPFALGVRPDSWSAMPLRSWPRRPAPSRVIGSGLTGLLAAGSASAVAPQPDAPQSAVANVLRHVARSDVPGPAERAAAGSAAGTRVAPPSAHRGGALAPSQQITVKAPGSAPTGSRVKMTGTVSPARSGLQVRVQRRYGGNWHTVATTRLTAKGTWVATLRTPSARGWLRYRAAASRNGTLAARTVQARRLDNYTRHSYVVVKRGKITVSMKDFAVQTAQ